MNKGLIGRISLFSLILLLIIALPAFASTNLTNNTTTAPVNQFQLNFTQTNATYNVTQVNFTLSGSLVFLGIASATNSSTNSSFTGHISGSTIYFGDNTTNSSSKNNWFAFNISSSSSGLFNITVTEVNNASGIVVSNKTVNITNGTITLVNATFSNFTYNGTSIMMNFTGAAGNPTGGDSINDNITFSLYVNNALWQTNYTCGATCTNGVGTINYTNASAGIYTFIFNTSGTNNYTSNSLTTVLNISQAVPVLNVFLSNTTANQTVNYSTSVEIRGNATLGNATVVNSPQFDIFIINLTPSSPATNATNGNPSVTTQTLGNGTYQIVYNTSGNANYTSAQNNTLYLLVNKGILNLSAFINDSGANKSVTYPNTVTVNGNTSSSGILPPFNLYVLNSSSYALFSNISQNTSNVILSSILLGNGTYNVIFNNTANDNWTVATNNTFYLLVNKGTLSISINGSNVTYPNSVLVNGTRGSNSVDADVNYTLWGNSTFFTSGNGTSGNLSNTTLLAAGWYVYTYNATGGTNWTANSTGVTLNINVSQGTPSLVITGPTGWAVTYPDSAIILCTPTSQNNEVTAFTFLYRNGANQSVATQTVSSPTADSYNYTCNSSATANYTAGQATPQLLTLSPASTSTSGSSTSTGTTSTSSSAYITLGVGKVNIISSSITTSGKLIASIAKYQDVAIRGMNITVVNNVANIKIVITKVNILPSNVPFDISGKVYNYISIDETNFTDSDINNVNIAFAVNKTWLTNNNIDASNITLYRWANNKWNDLGATKVSEDTSEVFYNVASPGLSVFVIGTKGVQAQAPSPTPVACTESWTCSGWSTCNNGVQTQTCTDSNNCGTTANKPTESQSCTSESNVTPPTSFPILSYVIVIVAIVVCVLIFLERNKITSYFQKSSKKKTQYIYKKPS